MLPTTRSPDHRRVPAVDIRRAEGDDLDPLTELMTGAFSGDPLWRWAFPDLGHLEVLWRLYIQSALRRGFVWVAGEHAAASVWIPPGESELTPEEDELVPVLIAE